MKNKLLIFKDKDINLLDTICILILIMVISGIIGFIYETIFYKIDLGYFTKRGSSFGPWVPIYGFGGLLLTIFTYKFKKNPLIVLMLSLFITGLLEYFTGYFLFIFKGIRLWDYNNELLNFGNINGFICLRSVLLFGISGLILNYILIPKIIKITNNIFKKKLTIFSFIIGFIYISDLILYGILN